MVFVGKMQMWGSGCSCKVAQGGHTVSGSYHWDWTCYATCHLWYWELKVFVFFWRSACLCEAEVTSSGLCKSCCNAFSYGKVSQWLCNPKGTACVTVATVQLLVAVSTEQLLVFERMLSLKIRWDLIGEFGAAFYSLFVRLSKVWHDLQLMMDDCYGNFGRNTTCPSTYSMWGCWRHVGCSYVFVSLRL